MDILVDVDLTTLKSDDAWWEWLRDVTKTRHLTSDLDSMKEVYPTLSYNLAGLFPKPFNDNIHPMDFWRREGVYDTIYPVDDVGSCLRLLSRRHTIIFVTHNKGNGSRSKYNNIERLMEGVPFEYVVTKEKHRIKGDVIIDDRNSFLNRCIEEGMKGIRLDTVYDQDVEQHPDTIVCRDWEEIYLLIRSWEY